MCKFMEVALLQAKKAKQEGEVPVGAVVVKNGQVISKAYNTREKTQNALHHAEILAIQKACKKLNSFRLQDCSLYVTLEPCPMCTGAIVNARVGQVFIGCKDEEFGCCGGKTNLTNGDFGYAPKITFGVMEKECKELIDDFFAKIREKNKLKRLLDKQIEVCNTSKGSFYLANNNKILCVVDEKNINKNLKIENDKLTNINKEKEFVCEDINEVSKCSKEKVFIIIDELKTGQIFFLCKQFDMKSLANIIKNLNLSGRIKIFMEGKEPIICDAKKLTKAEGNFNI